MKPFNFFRTVFISWCWLGANPPGRAAILLDEPFAYTNGPLVTVSGGLWQTHSGVAGQMEVFNGRADLSAPESEDVNALLSGQPYPATSGTVLYASFTANFSSLPSSSGDYFAHFKDTTTSNFRAKIFAQTSGAGPGQFRIGIANASNGPAAIFTTNLNLNTDYRIYVRYGISNATSALWVNPNSEASPSVIANDITTTRSIVAFALRQNTGIGVLTMDDLRIGTSFADVYVAPPVLPPMITLQPASIAAIENGIATFTVGASGTDPLTYQWKFNSTILPAATNSTLTLSNVNSSQAGPYSVTITNAAGSTNSASAILTVIQPSTNSTLTLVTYNVKGNFSTDWTTNAPQIQAIAREVRYLNPDVITFNEIPNSKTYEMTNFVNVFLPGYFMATNSGTDGSIRSVIVSRYPITRSQSWLDGAGLTNFGYAGTYTRDLFEAEITVPGATEPLHVFTTHLKSGSDGDSQDRRAAEAGAVSNFFATVFIPTNGNRPYVLTGDLNEDIDQPYSHNDQPIQRLISAPTGLHYTTPVNPFTLSPLTHSIQNTNGLDKRFDYIFPAGVLSSNIVSSEVFRTDLLDSPPPPLLADDDVTASDHLPVVMVFNYPDPPLRVTLTISNQTITLNWPALVGRNYSIQTSTNLTSWSVAASNIVALASLQTWTAGMTNQPQFFRVIRAQ